MFAKIVINLIFILGLVSLQAAFISALPGAVGNLNLILVILIFILGFASLEHALWWAVSAGAMLEIFSFLPFGAYLFSLSLTVAAAGVLLDYFFTSRSLYSFLALVALATAVYELAINVFLFFTSSDAPWLAANFWLSSLEQIGLNLIMTFLIFYLIHFLGRNFRPVFLIKGKQ